MFKPDEIIFAPTARCNLSCAHCRVSRIAEELSSADAIALLKDSADRGIERLGFSGGEPFLRQDFLRDVSKAAVDLGLFFDRIMTNGLWWNDEADLDASLKALYDAGFDGTFGLSFDRYHGIDFERPLAFMKAAHRVFRRRDCVELDSVMSTDDGPLFEAMKAIARDLGGELVMDDGEPIAIADSGRRASEARNGHDGSESAYGEELRVEIVRIPYSAAADGRNAADGGEAATAWKAAEWFKDDYCAGPGNVLYVHPDGQVAVCCGFANENKALIIGRIPDDDFSSLMERAAANPTVAVRYDSGLGKLRERLEAEGVVFPGKTDDICCFCDYVCGRKLG